MKRLVSHITQKRVHGLFTIFWTVMLLPSILWWRHSVPYLVGISVWALIAAHWSAFMGSRAEEAAQSDSSHTVTERP